MVSMESVYSMEPVPGGASPTSLDMLSLLDVLVNRTEEQCFSTRSRSTVLEGLPFGGVPTVLAINFILWLVSRPGPCLVCGDYSPQLCCQKLAGSTASYGCADSHTSTACYWCTWLVRATRVTAADQGFAHVLVGSRWYLGSSDEIVEQKLALRQEFCTNLGSWVRKQSRA